MHHRARHVLIAGHLNLDGVPQGFPQKQGELHAIVRDATLQAFERVVETALEKAVDTVILSGQLFADDSSVRALALFRDGVEALLDEGVQVVCAAPSQRIMERLRTCQCLPENLQLIGENVGVNELELFPQHATAQSSPLRLKWLKTGNISGIGKTTWGITSAPLAEMNSNSLSQFQDTVLICGNDHRSGSVRHGASIFHAPGPVQSLSNTTSGPNSITLITIDQNEHIQFDQISVAAINYAQVEYNLTAAKTTQALVQQLAQEWDEQLKKHAHEAASVWRVHWIIRGQHELLKSHLNSDLGTQLQDHLAQQFPDMLLVHHLVLAALPMGAELSSDQLHEETLADHFIRSVSQQELVKSANQMGSKEISLPVANLLSGLSQDDLRNRTIELGLSALNESYDKAG